MKEGVFLLIDRNRGHPRIGNVQIVTARNYRFTSLDSLSHVASAS
ncbi:hypothetical protein RMSM_04269 [Rhodopirellula maiorica SM1]|uniref:Uncharacterized protein n=1 Tax=Rhodopirellula maiorica SM1 TaxID=1265738 RepID=M5RY10_9BACT|nr:hypothetical protein RMSM_04269 [Rhodopirellula maiorica SM1]